MDGLDAQLARIAPTGASQPSATATDNKIRELMDQVVALQGVQGVSKQNESQIQMIMAQIALLQKNDEATAVNFANIQKHSDITTQNLVFLKSQGDELETKVAEVKALATQKIEGNTVDSEAIEKDVIVRIRPEVKGIIKQELLPMGDAMRNSLMNNIRPEVNRIVLEEISPLKLYLQKSLSNVSRFVQFINGIPPKIHDSSVDFALTIGDRLKKYGNKLQGKSADSSKHFAQVSKPHYELLEHMRKNNKAVYNKLAEFAKNVRSLDDEAQKAAILMYFQKM